MLIKMSHIQTQNFEFNLRTELVFSPLRCTPVLDEDSGKLAFCSLLADYSCQKQIRFYYPMSSMITFLSLSQL